MSVGYIEEMKVEMDGSNAAREKELISGKKRKNALLYFVVFFMQNQEIALGLVCVLRLFNHSKDQQPCTRKWIGLDWIELEQEQEDQGESESESKCECGV